MSCVRKGRGHQPTGKDSRLLAKSALGLHAVKGPVLRGMFKRIQPAVNARKQAGR